MRNAFIEELVSLATQYPRIALVVGDLGYSVVEPFADRFPTVSSTPAWPSRT
jgi:transketolase